MVHRLLLLLLGLALGANAECICGPSQTLGAAPFFYWSGAFDNETKAACYIPGGVCTYTATGSDTQGIDSISFVAFPDSCGSATVVVADGGNPVFTVNSANSSDPSILAYASLTKTMTFTLTLQENTPCALTLIMYPNANGFRTTPVPTTTTTVLTTSQYLNTQIPINPFTVALDLAFVFVTSSSDSDLFKKMKNASVDAISALDVVVDAKASNTDATRLTLQTFTPVAADNIYSVPWQLSKTSCVGGINGLELIPANSTWTSGLDSMLKKFFNITSAVDQLPRKNAQRVYAVFTQTDPTDSVTAITTSLRALSGDDVHMVIVDFRPTPSDYFKSLMQQNITNLAYMNYDASNQYYFMNKYITNGDSDPNFGCAPANPVVDVSGGLRTLTFPSKYDGSSVRYCNNQDVTVSIVNTNTNAVSLCFTVSKYELEVERDYLRIFDGNGKEQVSLTGFDVSGTQFLIPTANATVRFQTNANQVYGGVNMTIASGNC